jgi:hypothetical protein
MTTFPPGSVEGPVAPTLSEITVSGVTEAVTSPTVQFLRSRPIACRRTPSSSRPGARRADHTRLDATVLNVRLVRDRAIRTVVYEPGAA